MQSFLNHFLKLTQIPRCSYDTDLAQKHILTLANNYGYKVLVDRAGNILATTEGSQITLQSHYDMVCVGKAPQIETTIDGNIISAKESSLGADNGIGCAMMLALMQEGAKVDCLFTNDEEVGLVGANNLELNIKTKKMVNLDSQEYGKIYLGCAGGVDLKFKKENRYVANRYKYIFEVSCFGDGGHSGVDIDKGIQNPIIEIAKFLDGKDCALVAFSGGERTNAIPAYSKAIVATNKLLADKDIEVVQINKKYDKVLSNSKELIHKIATFNNGVLSYDKNLHTVQDSCNFAIIKDNSFQISFRSMKSENLEIICNDAIKHFGGYEVEKSGRYEPWEPIETEFAKEVQQKYIGSSFAAIHAGLECAIIKKKYPHLEIVSIGPDIYFPHSVKERCDLESCEKIFKLIKTLL